MGARKGGGRRSPLENKKKVWKKKMDKQNFNLQKAPIACYAWKFPHKRPHVMR